MKVCQKCVAKIPHNFKHGKNGHNYHKCRCPICCKAVSEHNDKLRNGPRKQELLKRRRELYYQNADKIREAARKYQATKRAEHNEYMKKMEAG